MRPQFLGELVLDRLGRLHEAGLVDAVDDLDAHALELDGRLLLEGEGLASPIEDSQLFPPAAVQMVRVGENTGTIDQQLENAAQFYSRELDYKLKRLTTLFEPAVIASSWTV